MKALIIISLMFGMTFLFAGDAKVGPKGPEKGAHKGKGHGKAFLLKKFDKDKDGKLNEAERAELKKAIEARKANLGSGDAPKGKGKCKGKKCDKKKGSEEAPADSV